MFAALKRFMEQHLNPDDAAGAMSASQHLELATAALLLDMARMDQAVDARERAAAAAALQRSFALDEAQTEELLVLAERRAAASNDYYQFTSVLNRELGPEQKVRVIEQLWTVAFADGRLDKYEEHLVRKLAELLYVSHSEFIAAKLRVMADA